MTVTDGADAEGARVLDTWNVPATAGDTQEIAAEAGKATVIVGANGTGKSALAVWMTRESVRRRVPVHRVLAHRQNWFANPGPGITAPHREQLMQQSVSWNEQPQSRTEDRISGNRPQIALFDLLAQLHKENETLASTARRERRERPEVTISHLEGAGLPSILDRINSVLDRSQLGIQLSLNESGAFDATNRRGETYPISNLSDGEKNALLLAAEVLTAEVNSILIVDEPERHLHRSVASLFTHALLAERNDCHFVILTHDLDLVSRIDSDAATTNVLTGCHWSGVECIAWKLHQVLDADGFPEEVRRAILGGREKVLFVEGIRHGLDWNLHSIVFPDWFIAPVGSAQEVIHATLGLVGSERHHWLTCRGIIDGDRMTDEERAGLRRRGVHVLPVNEIESIYYQSFVIDAVAEKHGELVGDPEGMKAQAHEAVSRTLRQEVTTERLALSNAQKTLVRALTDQIPSRELLASGVDPVTLSFVSPLPAERSRLSELFDAGDVDAVVREYSVRETPMASQVASALHFQNSKDYEAAALKVIEENRVVRNQVTALVGSLPDASETP